MSDNRKYQQALLRQIHEDFPHVRAEIGPQRKKHHQVLLHHGNNRRFVIFPASPSDGVRGMRRTMNDVRKELRVMGAIQ